MGPRGYLSVLLFTCFFIITVVSSCSLHNNKDAFRAATIDSFLNTRLSMEDSNRFFYMVDSAFDQSPWQLYYKYSDKRAYYTYKKDYTRALTYVDSMLLVMANRPNDNIYFSNYANALILKGDALLALQRYDEAFQVYYLASQSISTDTFRLIQFCNRLGMVCYKQKKYSEAAEYYKKGFRVRAYGGNASYYMNFAMQQSNLDNIGLCYSKLNKTDSALLYFDSTLSYIDRYDQYSSASYNEMARAVVYGNKAKALADIGNDSAAERLLNESIRINRLPAHALEDVPYSLAKLATLYLKHNKLPETNHILAQLKAGLDTAPNAEMLIRWNQLQSIYYEKMNDYRQADFYLNRYIKVNDSVTATQQQMLNIDINKTFSYFKSEYDLSALQKENRFKSISLLIATLLFVMGVVIIFLTRKNYLQARKHVKTLEVLNESISLKNDRLQKALFSLEKSQEENGRMLRIVAHDLRSPISGIHGLSDLLLRNNNHTAQEKAMLELIYTSSTHSIELIKDILHIPVASEEMNRERVDMTVLLKYCIELLQPRAAEKTQRIELKTVPAVILGDNERLWRVFSNLITNAIKFSPLHSLIEVSMQLKDNHVIVSVRDNGIGIPAHLMDKVFESSKEAKRKGTAGEPSFGLGLAICKQIVIAHNGSIWAESEPGKETTFYTSFPLV